MYTLVKHLITEKYLKRQIAIVENLVNTDRLTSKELASLVNASERTIFNDLQDVRQHLPQGWQLEADGQQGLKLSIGGTGNTNDMWEHYMQGALGIQIVKQLLFTKTVPTQTFIHQLGISYESLKREIKKINPELEAYQIQIDLKPQTMSWQGEESSIRIFYHRLLMPFTHTNFFFSEYAIKQENYERFLTRLERQDLDVKNETIFGICWFYINTIRQRAQCPIEGFSYRLDDPLYQMYRQELIKLYAHEGIQLADDELFFAFFCFVDSWNYEVDSVHKRLFATHYPVLMRKSEEFVALLSQQYQLPNLKESNLAENMTLFLLKYFESEKLSDKFLMEYHDVLAIVQQKFPDLFQFVRGRMRAYGMEEMMSESLYACYTAVLIIQEAIYQIAPLQIKAYFIFQGEPAWKSFLAQELQAALGSRVDLQVLASPLALEADDIQAHDLFIANHAFTLKSNSQATIHYISSVPTVKELDKLRQAVRYLYL